MKVSDGIARALAAAGITHVFLIQGAANNDIIYSIADTEGIDYVCAGHEQAAGFMAEGYAKVSGKPGVAIATSGPGGQNLLTAIANCYYDSVPAVFITGQVNSQFLRPEDSNLRQLGFQETDIVAMAKPVTKLVVQVCRPDAVQSFLEQALWLCQDGRPGPVLLDLPIDVQRADVDWSDLPAFIPSPSYTLNRFSTHTPQLEELIDALYQAQRPVLLIGGGVRSPQAIEALDVLAELLRCPLIPTWNALDVIASDHPWYGGRVGTYGGPGRNFTVQNADLLLGIGTRFSGRITGGKPETFARGAKRYAVDVDPAQLAEPTIQLDGKFLVDAVVFLRTLEQKLRQQRIEGRKSLPDWDQWVTQVKLWRERYDPVRPEFWSQEAIHPYAFARQLSEMLPANAVIVSDCGGNVVTMNHTFQTKRGQRYFSSNGNSPMGFALAGAIGAWYADPSRPVVCVIGDGGLSINIQELQTLAHYHISVKVFVLDNGCYGITRQYQQTNFAGRCLASGPDGYSAPSFDHVAEAFGVMNFKLTKTVQFDVVIDTALRKVDGPCVCIVKCDGFATYEPRLVGWATPIEDLDPKLPRDELRKNLIGVEPLSGWETGEYR